jgi:actin related protein 2/3 complex subunit 1A/1B
LNNITIMTTVHKFGATPISCHSWGKDRNSLALCHNSKEVALYTNSGNMWQKSASLDQHDLLVTGIDWAPNTNRIVTCSSDRNAYVWVKGEDGTWRHTLVLLRINRAATCVRWSPEENKFAVGSGAKIISVCYYEKDNDWWVAKHIKKPLKSTVTSLDWHPNNILLAAGSTDFKVRVYSGYIKELESKPSATPWGARMPMGQLLAEFSNSPNGGGWVHSVSFSSDGSRLAWVGHDSSISVADSNKEMAVMKLRTDLLPFLTLTWVTENTLVAAGHNCVPITFTVDGAGTVSLGGRLEEDKKQEGGGGASSAMRMFQNKDRLGQSELESKLNTTHQNQISELRIHSGTKGNVQTISTVAGDGKLVLWDINTLASKMKNLVI